MEVEAGRLLFGGVKTGWATTGLLLDRGSTGKNKEEEVDEEVVGQSEKVDRSMRRREK